MNRKNFLKNVHIIYSIYNEKKLRNHLYIFEIIKNKCS